MGCVNVSSREFKDLAARHNLDSTAMELIVHKYWLETGKEDLFPTDVYIQAQLGNGQYKEESPNVRKLWDKLYSSNKEYDSLAKVEDAIEKASRFFPSSAISYYRNAKGNYVLSVKKPVKKINNSKDDFFDAMDNMKSMRDVKSLNLDIKEKQTYGIGKVQELYNRFNTDRTSKDLADRVFDIARDLGIQISFNESLPFGTMGRYHSSNTIIFKKSFLERDTMNDKKASILLHEVLHAVTMYALSDKISDDKKSKALNDFKVEMNFLYQDLKNNPLLEGERGIVDVKEFVAELGNPVFRSKLQQIDRDNAAKEKLNQSKKSLWNRVLDAFKHLLGLHTTNSYYQRSMNALDNALNAFDIDTYMRYSGIKNHLRKETANIETKIQYNAKLSVIDNAAQSGNWTSSALKELDNLIDDIENGKATYQRFPQEAARGWHQGGRANEAASLLLRTNESSSTENTRSFSESQRRSQEEKPIQERIIENWAKAEGIWHDNLDSIEGREFLAEGGEAKVFANSGDTKVTKILSTGYFITPQLALDRITLHNTLFPIAPMKVIGFGRNSKGEFQLLVEQPFIQGEPATQEEIDKYISKMGFIKSQKDNGHTFVSDDLYLSDLHDENVIKTPQGILVVIDADLRLNTPELEMGGKYQVDDSVLSQNEYQAKEFIKTLSSEQLEDETKLIQQESADYDIAFAIEEEPKKSKAVPQDFTFNDGTKVKAPFMPNAQQIDALNAMSDFIKSDATSMTLSGYAGTGKTSLMEMIAQKCRKDYRDVIFCASTNKAAAVLNDKVQKSGFKASTLNKIFGISVEMDTNQKSYNAKNLVNVLRNVDILPGTTVIIDEASMINEENYEILNEIAARQELKIIYVGDSAQLAPVNESKISKVFRNNDGKVITLTQVERTDDNAILKEATDIRNGKPMSGESSFNSKGEGVAYIPTTHKDAISEVISHYIKGLKKDPNFFRILAYTNKAVAAYNNYARKLLGYTSPTPQAGEPMTGYENWGYDWKTKTYRFINSESYKVIGTSEPKTVSITLGNGTKVIMQAIPLTLEDSLGIKDTFDFMDIKSNPQNKQSAIILANEKKRLYALAKRTVGKKAKAEIYQQINTIDKFLFVNDNIIDDQGNYLQTKTIDFGYALTVHKSQGSTFTHVLMDDVDISKATSESTNIPIIVEDVNLDGKAIDASNTIIDKEEKVDLGDLTPAILEQKQDNPQTVNLRQQLEYVGVSRATDTVTIISDDVKKEGSPLHPEKNLKDNTINPASQRSTVTEPQHQGFISDGARQLVEHLKSMGLNVLGKADMEKFFKEHPEALVQMARAYSKEKPYLNSKYKKQVPQILDIVKANKYDKPGTDAVTLESEGHKTIYLIDHSADKELADNLKKGDGFGIRKAFNVDKLSKDDCRTIIRNIAADYGRSEVSIRRKLQNLGIKAEHMLGIDIAAELKMGTDVDAGLVLPRGREGFSLDNNRSSVDGRESKEGSRQENKNGNESIEFYTTPQGEIYGFVDKDGNIYLDETKISPEHPIHEYTHLWDRIVAQKKQELWNRGVELMKQTSLWNDVLNDANYGKKWQAIKDISQEKLESLVASEVHSRLVGKEGADILAKLAKEKGKEGIIAKLKQWVLDFWKDLKTTFGDWSKNELDKLTLEDFNNMTVRDLANGLNPLEMKENTINNNSNNGTEYKQTDEFRRVQEAVRGSGREASRGRSVFEGYLTPDQRQHLADVLKRQLGSINSFIHGSSRTIVR